ncbi:MAG: MMPL family transporter [Phycisphaerales bacterium]|nr:MMPL family transporter [Phycisphaerales bacterium]
MNGREIDAADSSQPAGGVVDRWARWFDRHRRLVAILLALLTALAAFGVSRLRLENDLGTLFRSHDEAALLVAELARDFGDTDTDCIFLIEGDVFSPAGIGGLRRLTSGLRKVSSVRGVHSLLDIPIFATGAIPTSLVPANADAAALVQSRQVALRHPLVAERLLSADARTTMVIAHMRRPAGDRFRPVVADLRRVAGEAMRDSGLGWRLTGLPPVRVDIHTMLERQQRRFLTVGGVAGFAMALLVFRRIAPTLIVAPAALLGAFWAMGAMGLAGEPVNVINTIMAPLVLMIGFADAVHLIHHMRHATALGVSPRSASMDALRRLTLPCFLTSITTAAGFASLATADVSVIRRFGLACAVATLIAFVAVIAFTPLMGGTRLGGRLGRNTPTGSSRRAMRGLEQLARLITARPRVVVGIGLAVCAALAWLASGLRADNQIRETLPSGSETAMAIEQCDRAFGGALRVYAVLDYSPSLSWDSPELLAALSDTHAVFERSDLISAPLSLLSVALSLPGSDPDARAALLPAVPNTVLARFVNPERRRAIVMGRIPDCGSAAAQPELERVAAALQGLESRTPDIRFRLAGSTVVAVKMTLGMISDLARSLIVAAIVIFGVMTLELRSIRLGLISVVPNAFPLLVAAAGLRIVGMPLQLSSVIVFSVCLGVAVDDTIHLLSRFRREVAIDGDPRAAVHRSFVAVGSAVLTTTAVLMAGFGVALLSELPSIRTFAAMSMVALAAALVGDLILLPALLVLFPDRRALDRISDPNVR